MSRSAPIQPTDKPDDFSLQLSIQEATFKWEASLQSALDKEKELRHIKKQVFSLNVQAFAVKRNSILGVTGEDGAGKTSFTLALLGHMPLRKGEYRRSGAITYYPEWPYIMEDCSIRQNVLFAGETAVNFNESHYRDALATVHLHISQDFDTIPQSTTSLDKQWLQRISLARALYEER